MQKNNFLIILTLSCSFLIGLPKTSVALDDTIIAVINDDIITFHDLSNHLSSIYSQMKRDGVSETEIQATMSEMQENGLNLLIEHMLILDAAESIGVSVKPIAINRKVEEIKKQYPSEQVFIEALVMNGETITDLRDKVEEQLKTNYVIDTLVRSKISVNPQEVTAYYKENLPQFQKPETIKLDSIHIQYSDDKTKDLIRAKEALAKIKSGKAFEVIAKEYSDSPSIGSIEKGTSLPEIEAAVFNLNTNELSDVIKTNAGFFIFKAKEKSNAVTIPLEDVKNIVEERVFMKKFKDAYQMWVKKLKDEAYIELKQ